MKWRKRVGIEPTAASISLRPDGFEGRAGHQTRVASIGLQCTWRRPGLAHRLLRNPLNEGSKNAQTAIDDPGRLRGGASLVPDPGPRRPPGRPDAGEAGVQRV